MFRKSKKKKNKKANCEIEVVGILCYYATPPPPTTHARIRIFVLFWDVAFICLFFFACPDFWDESAPPPLHFQKRRYVPAITAIFSYPRFHINQLYQINLTEYIKSQIKNLFFLIIPFVFNPISLWHPTSCILVKSYYHRITTHVIT